MISLAFSSHDPRRSDHGRELHVICCFLSHWHWSSMVLHGDGIRKVPKYLGWNQKYDNERVCSLTSNWASKRLSVPLQTNQLRVRVYWGQSPYHLYGKFRVIRGMVGQFHQWIGKREQSWKYEFSEVFLRGRHEDGSKSTLCASTQPINHFLELSRCRVPKSCLIRWKLRIYKKIVYSWIKVMGQRETDFDNNNCVCVRQRRKWRLWNCERRE